VLSLEGRAVVGIFTWSAVQKRKGEDGGSCHSGSLYGGVALSRVLLECTDLLQ
jgi:hypothetical protein